MNTGRFVRDFRYDGDMNENLKAQSSNGKNGGLDKIEDYLERGLSREAVVKRRAESGRNELEGKRPPTDWDFLVRQFKNPLVLVLVVAGLVTVWLQEFTDSAVIGLAVVVNTVLGFIQERNAQRGLEALQKVLTPRAMVRRDGEQQEMDARELVPGDVVLLYEGDKVPADGVVAEATDLLINEAILTGESVPVRKIGFELSKLKGFKEAEFNWGDWKPGNLETEAEAFMGTVVASGSGVMVVSKIGMHTEVGKIAKSLEEEQEGETPLEKRLSQLARWLTIGVMVAAIGVFGYGLASGRDPVEMFELSVALAVAAIPEGLVVALTAILAIGMQRILKHKALVRKLVAAETLGTVTVVCVDKTGTLTEGDLKVMEVDFTDEVLGMRAGALANDLRDGTELARWSWLRERARKKVKGAVDPQVWVDEFPRDESIPFSTDARFLATRHKREVFVMGAPEVVLGWSQEKQESRVKSRERIEELGNKGRRMIGLAYFKARSIKETKEMFADLRDHKFAKVRLRWLGLMAYADPIREGVKTALRQAQEAGVEVKVITGDYRPTAEAVMKELGIDLPDGSVMEGFELEKLKEEVLQRRIKDVKLFARTRPQQKLRIVKALKAKGEVVGMMGDGVNDAPAITAADIGIVVGEATEVAREAADMVLLDNNFRTIVGAIAEGRGIFDNLRKIILYLLSDTFSELILVIGSLVMGWPLAISAAQILWINLIDDGLPNLALTIDPRDKNVLKRKPISPKLPLIDSEIAVLIGVISLVTGLASLAIFGWFAPRFGQEFGRTIVFAALGLDSLLYVFSCRSLTKNIWEESLGENRWLVGAVLVGLGLTVVPIYVPWLRMLLGLEVIFWQEWLMVGALSLGVVGVIEAVKLAYKKLDGKKLQ